jgi:hypothetical protein
LLDFLFAQLSLNARKTRKIIAYNVKGGFLTSLKIKIATSEHQRILKLINNSYKKAKAMSGLFKP